MSLAQSFARTGFARFVNSPAGRVVRIVAGVILITLGYAQRTETKGMAVMVLGLVPLSAGLFDLCFISALLGGPIQGSRVGKSGPKPEGR